MARAHQPFPIYVRELEVVDAFDVTPRMRRVVLTGDQLRGFTSDTGYPVGPFRTENADDHVKVVVLDDAGRVSPPGQADGVLDWTPEALERSRDYTPRRFDAEAGRLELDFVRHEGGLASAWAEQVRPGDRVHVAGPRGTTVLPPGIDWYLLVGDETALPAIARRIEELPAGTPVTAVVSVADADEVEQLQHEADLDITWVTRDTAGPDAFLEAVRGVRWRDGQVYAWAAGEAGMLREVRRWLRKDVGVDPAYVDVAGYWRAGASQSELSSVLGELRHQADLAVPYAVRVAVTLDLAEHVLEGRRTVAELAAAAGADPRGLRKVLQLLAFENLFTVGADDTVGLTERGATLTEEVVHDRVDDRLGQGRLDGAWPGLLHAVRTGTSGYEHARGRSFWAEAAEDDRLGSTFDEGLAGWSGIWAPAAVRALSLGPGAHVVDVGGGTGALLACALATHADARGTVVDLPTTAARARTELARLGYAERSTVVEQSFFEPLPTGGDVYVLAQVLHDWPDAEARLILSRLAEAAGDARVVLVERLAEELDHDHDVAFDLQLYAAFGGGERTRTEYAELAASVGLRLARETGLGEDMFLLELTR